MQPWLSRKRQTLQWVCFRVEKFELISLSFSLSSSSFSVNLPPSLSHTYTPSLGSIAVIQFRGNKIRERPRRKRVPLRHEFRVVFLFARGLLLFLPVRPASCPGLPIPTSTAGCAVVPAITIPSTSSTVLREYALQFFSVSRRLTRGFGRRASETRAVRKS